MVLSTPVRRWKAMTNFSTRFVALALLLLSAVEAQAAELLMYRRAGCPWCAAWDQAIGPVYPKTELGRLLPLRHVDLAEDRQPPVSLVRPVRYTPTFVLVEDGREVGRIEGYPGEEFFWSRLEALARGLPAPRS
jgi:thioredoxin-related protein